MMSWVDDTGKKALLIILDGWGIGDKGKDDVILQTEKYAHVTSASW